MRRRGVALAVALLAGLPAPGAAQPPEGAGRIPESAVRESLAVLRELDRAVTANRLDAAAWHRRGMIGWVLYERSRNRPPVRGLDWTLLTRLADTSLRRALEIEPDNDTYFIAVAQFLKAAAIPQRLWGPYAVFDEAVQRARDAGDPARLAQAALEAGRVHLMRYDYASTCAAERPERRSFGLQGEAEYLRALILFVEAFETAPGSEQAFRHVALMLAERDRWDELGAFARAHLERMPSSGWGSMVRGLASLRLGDDVTSTRAFDDGLRNLDPEERQRIDRIERVLGDGDRGRYAQLDDSARAAEARMYWLNHDPLWSVPGISPRLEFLARSTFAELRWTYPEQGINGIDSDVGYHFIRTGVKRKIYAESRVLNVYWQEGCAPARLEPFTWNDTTVRSGPPANWTTIEARAMPRMRVDSIPTQVARFRAAGDSTDVLFVTLAPARAIHAATDVFGPVRQDLWLLSRSGSTVGRDSVRLASEGVQTFRRRVPPGTYVYRTEASADGSLVAGRATAAFTAGDDARTGFRASGFGMSDVLVATRAEPRQAPALRWTAFDIAPVAGPVQPASELALLWEIYDLVNDAGRARYSVSIVIRRPSADSAAAAGIAPRVIRSLAEAVGINRIPDGTELTYERETAHQSAFADHIVVGLGATAPGRYLLTLQVVDRTNGHVVGRSQELVVAAPPPPARRRSP